MAESQPESSELKEEVIEGVTVYRVRRIYDKSYHHSLVIHNKKQLSKYIKFEPFISCILSVDHLRYTGG